jgi:hypothetical protein
MSRSGELLHQNMLVRASNCRFSSTNRVPLSADLGLQVAGLGPHLAICPTFRPDGPMAHHQHLEVG